ncbi:hypothetical protein J2T56_002048 [Natronobacillus azotifigens]|uniref:Uncharacterized protein n=1 Tax=Natronobacillus azotifigens TaxID=472978 RepID=A0A9J6REE0_9BACI|nr:hypothetical protein [Natronobacillus azotifigens]MCZ0703829.1 hypothetical protein [Natronobacillus azotifigens]
MYFSPDVEERVVEGEDYIKYSSGDIRFNVDEQRAGHVMPITIENESSRIYAYADRKSFGFPNNTLIVELWESNILLGKCLITSGELCDFEKNQVVFGEGGESNNSSESYKNLTLPPGDYWVYFISQEKHTWEPWVKVE